MRKDNASIQRRILKELYKLSPAIPLLSLEDRERTFYDDYDSFTEYGFMPEKFNSYSDAEIREFFEDHVVERIDSQYDCTGKRFTLWYTFHRNPNGRISYTHRFGIDV